MYHYTDPLFLPTYKDVNLYYDIQQKKVICQTMQFARKQRKRGDNHENQDSS